MWMLMYLRSKEGAVGKSIFEGESGKATQAGWSKGRKSHTGSVGGKLTCIENWSGLRWVWIGYLLGWGASLVVSEGVGPGFSSFLTTEAIQYLVPASLQQPCVLISPTPWLARTSQLCCSWPMDDSFCSSKIFSQENLSWLDTGQAVGCQAVTLWSFLI